MTALSKQSVRDTHTILTDGRLPLRLMGLIIAVLLAVTAGILVISTPHAAASGEHPASAATILGHDHATHSHGGVADVEPASAHYHASARNDCGDPASGDHGSGGTDCCTMGACHAVQALTAPVLHMPCASAAVLAVVGDQQVEGVIPGGLDRPPRTA
ncbi:hypothetical protein [Microvirga splendida]|uniref:CopL family metal-binding regulatory protein n=1 Tax=Microvirga splendida TaxID=2795727 RepID=A0ABS0Y637_9HYPH|nr:hypothetical protein [Microvirga splendida]MBJ6127759.1 hypothetical protein [Microvirga splendida]